MKRLGARILDNLIFLPFRARSRRSSCSPRPFRADLSHLYRQPTEPLSGIFWLEITVAAVGLVCGLIYIVHDAFCTVRGGRSRAIVPLWCVWDNNRQCLHDKVVSTIVVQD